MLALHTKNLSRPQTREDSEMRDHAWVSEEGIPPMVFQVQCYAGRKADEKPVKFQMGEREFLVEEILDQWYGPNELLFKVRAEDGDIYILRHDEREDEWSLESFRRAL
jgi:hypothetical protein